MNKDFLYLNVYNAVREDILSGTYAPGARLPDSKALENKFGVSAITIKRALEKLQLESVVRRVQGRGTFVSDARPHGEHERIIGVILEHVASPFGLDLMYRIDELAANNGFVSCVRFSYGNIEKESREIAFLKSIGARGMIIMPAHSNYYSSEILRLVVEDYPLVFIDKYLDSIPVTSVCTNNVAAINMLVDYLVSINRRRIGFVGTTDNGTSSVSDRHYGFSKRFYEYSSSRPQECIVPIKMFTACAQENHKLKEQLITDFLIEHGRKLDSVICSEYGFVPELMQCAASLGISVPGDLEVCCVDADYHDPEGFNLTHVKQDEHRIAGEAFNALMDIIENGRSEPKKIMIEPLFKPRKREETDCDKEGIYA